MIPRLLNICLHHRNDLNQSLTELGRRGNCNKPSPILKHFCLTIILQFLDISSTYTSTREDSIECKNACLNPTFIDARSIIPELSAMIKGKFSKRSKWWRGGCREISGTENSSIFPALNAFLLLLFLDKNFTVNWMSQWWLDWDWWTREKKA